MFQKFTALILLWLMTVVVATSQPGLNYCLCLHQVFVGGCACDQAIETEGCEHVPQEAPCGCCSEESPEIEVKSPAPYQNCLLSLQVELDDFIGVDSIQAPRHEGAEFVTPPSPFCAIDSTFTSITSIHGIRGSPPPRAGLIPSVSLHKIYSVFLL